jgi:hypothetical protein
MEFDKPYQEIKLEVIDKFSEKQEGCDTLLLIEVPEVEEFVDYKHLQFIYKRLFEAGLDIKIKYHPPEKRDELIKNDIEGYPTEIPGEFLLKNVKSNVVSLYSLSLITASFFENLKAISLLEIVKWKDQELIRKHRRWLEEESCGQIIFPKSVDELIDILKR